LGEPDPHPGRVASHTYFRHPAQALSAIQATLEVVGLNTPTSLTCKEIVMFEQEQRPQQQISREAAQRFAIMVAIAARKAETKRVRRQRRRSAMRTEPVEAR
jgi:hypothetical protein